MDRPFGYFELFEAFSGSGCALCRLALRDVDRFLDSLLYEHVTDPELQRKYRASRGLCNEHSWQLVRHKGNSLGIAILYGAVIDDLLKAMESAPNVGRRFPFRGTDNTVATRLRPKKPCAACQSLADSQQRWVQAFVQNVVDTGFQQAYGASSGVCLPHFCQVLSEMPNDGDLRQLLSLQRTIWTRLRAELEEFQAKNDYRRIREAMGSEGDSWLRAIGLVAGETGVFGLNSHA
jgi:Family of unknown function (DUF6062)